MVELATFPFLSLVMEVELPLPSDVTVVVLITFPFLSVTVVEPPFFLVVTFPVLRSVVVRVKPPLPSGVEVAVLRGFPFLSLIVWRWGCHAESYVVVATFPCSPVTVEANPPLPSGNAVVTVPVLVLNRDGRFAAGVIRYGFDVSIRVHDRLEVSLAEELYVMISLCHSGPYRQTVTLPVVGSIV